MQEITDRLKMLGYADVTNSDKVALGYIEKITSDSVCMICNKKKLPPELRNVVMENVCGQFLKEKKLSGQDSGLDLELAVKSVKDGDTDVVFSADKCKTPEQRLDTVIDYLCSYGKREVQKFRSLKW